MRKIISKQESDKKKKRNQLIVGGILISVMFLSVMGYAFQNALIGNVNSNQGNSTQTINYNGVSFSNQNGFWATQYENSRLVFTYNPSEITAMNLSAITKTISDFSGKPLYIYYGDSNYDAESEISFNLKNFASSVILKPINESSNADCSYNSIILEDGTSGVKENLNCIYIYGQGEELIKTADNILYKMMGIM